MNELVTYLILGFIQGVTEFFPISSSGHLVLSEHFLKVKNPGASAEIVAHFGTLFSIILFYKATFFSNKNSDDFFHINTLKMLAISTVPAVLVGLFSGLSENFDLETLFGNYDFVKFALLCNGGFLIALSGLRDSMEKSTIFENPSPWQWNYKTSFFLGLFQALAMLPGISRSGMVISYGLFVGLEKKKIIQYAFFMAIPVIVLSIVYKLIFSDGPDESISPQSGLMLFLSSFVFGYLSLTFLIRFLERFSFAWFGLYCIIIGMFL